MRLAWLVLAIAACGDQLPGPPDVAPADYEPPRLLVYTRTLGYRHDDAITAGGPALVERLTRDGIATDVTEDPLAFRSENLVRYRAVLFLYTSGNDILDAGGKVALEAYVRGGGGWMGIHSAADTEYEWPFYQGLVITHYVDHPVIQQATLVVEGAHPATAPLPAAWVATDEWYNFAADPRATSGVHVLATIDEASYTGGTMGADHPMIWSHERFGGRALYCELGHVAARWTDDATFLELVAASARWVMRQ